MRVTVDRFSSWTFSSQGENDIKGACSGDLGSALYIYDYDYDKYVAVGIFSYGDGCLNVHSPTYVFTY